MHPRLAASLFALGVADLAYVNLELGPRVFATGGEAVALLLPPASTGAEAPSALPPVPDVRQAAAAAAAPPVLVAPPSGRDPLASPAPEAAPAELEPPAPDALALADTLSVQFSAGTAQLTPGARERLVQLGLRLREQLTWSADIVGHTDARGSQQLNYALGEHRARVVARLLRSTGVSADRLQVESRGEDEPEIQGSSEAAWSANRRVEISIRTARSETP